VSSSELASPQNPLGEEAHHLRIEASKGFRALRLGEIWEYRELLWFMTSRDIKARYRQMALGPIWIILQPIVDTIVFSVIFGNLAQMPSDRLPYPLFTFTSLTIWSFFSGATNSAVSSLVSRMGVISKVYFPRLIVPLGGIVSAAVDMAVSFVILIFFMIFYGYPPSPNIIYLPLFILLAAVSALGIGLWSAAIAVRFRDFRNIITYGLRLGMYATPVAFATSAIPEKWQTLFRLNPMFWAVEGFRWSILGVGQKPDVVMLIPISIVLVLLISGLFVFRKAERTVVDWL
jgi:lipopolysaccharide transport system permease protein